MPTEPLNDDVPDEAPKKRARKYPDPGNRRSGPCPLTKSAFRKGAASFRQKIGDVDAVVAPKEFSSGAFGWYAQGKAMLDVDGTPVKCQYQLVITVINSKGAAEA